MRATTQPKRAVTAYPSANEKSPHGVSKKCAAQTSEASFDDKQNEKSPARWFSPRSGEKVDQHGKCTSR